MKIAYVEKNFREASLDLISQVNRIVSIYSNKGYSLTLRQVYYQLVARDIIPNNERSYKNLGNLLNDARLAGLLDWESIEDRTRQINKNSHWRSPKDILSSCAASYQIDKRKTQEHYIEVWVEKDAMIDIVEQISSRLDVTCLSCRGYFSASSMWSASQRLVKKSNPVVLHLGDHDPSGIDMSRDIQDRLAIFGVQNLTFKRLALNMDQVDLYSPPPNPAKITDTRSSGYISQFGESSWELDALDPEAISNLIYDAVSEYTDDTEYSRLQKEEVEARGKLLKLAANGSYIMDNLDSILSNQ